MANVIIPARKSLTISDKFPGQNINNNLIYVGNDGIFNYVSYLFFDISSLPSDISILYAELVLFKVDRFYNDYNKIFEIYSLDEYFSTYTTFNNHPKINDTLRKDFYPITKKAVVTIPITSFVKLWIKNPLVNSSIMLCGKNKKSITHFGSAICSEDYLVPFLKVTFKPSCYNKHFLLKQKRFIKNMLPYLKCNSRVNNKKSKHSKNNELNNLYIILLNSLLNYYHLKPTIRKVHVTGTIAPYSKYNAVVNVKIKRHRSNHIDNYYVADQYDNLLNKKPLHIDKDYNIAIIPIKDTCDTENISFYGSYIE